VEEDGKEPHDDGMECPAKQRSRYDRGKTICHAKEEKRYPQKLKIDASRQPRKSEKKDSLGDRSKRDTGGDQKRRKLVGNRFRWKIGGGYFKSGQEKTERRDKAYAIHP